MAKNLQLISLVIISLATWPAQAANYFVDGCVVGNDANNGTSLDTPFRTIYKAISLAQPGDSIMIRGQHSAVGLHENFSGLYSREAIDTMPSGTADLRIVVQNYSNENVILDGDRTKSYAFANAATGFGYVTIRGLEFKSYNEASILIGSTTTEGVSAVDNLIEHCTFRDSAGKGLLVKGLGAAQILRTVIRVNTITNNNAEGIVVSGTNSETSLVQNEISSNLKEGILVEGSALSLLIEKNDLDINGLFAISITELAGAGTAKDFKIRFNTMVGDYGGGISLHATDQGELRANLINNCKGPGIVLEAIKGPSGPIWIYNSVISLQNGPGFKVNSAASGIRFVFNTLYQNDQSTLGEVGEVSIATDVTDFWLVNNLIYSLDGGTPLAIESEALIQAESNLLSLNDYFSLGKSQVIRLGSQWLTAAEFGKLTGNTQINDNPKMTDPLRDDFSIPTKSPCAYAAQVFAEIIDDYANTQRGERPSIGAYEAKGSPANDLPNGCGRCDASAGEPPLLAMIDMLMLAIFLLRKRHEKRKV